MYIWVAIAFLADVSFADLPNGKCFIANRADPTHGFQNQTAVLDEQNQKMEQEEKKQEQEKQIKDQHQKDFEHEQQQMQFLEDQKQQQKQKQLNNQNIAPIKQKSLDSQKNRDFKPNKDLDTQSCIDAHNEARKSIGLPYLRWNANLASSASNYAAKLESLNYLVHSKGPYGENLYSGTASCTNAVANWVGERYKYWGQSIGSGDFHGYGHYSQIVFPAVKEVGCGISGVYVVCHYDKTQISGTKLSKY